MSLLVLTNWDDYIATMFFYQIGKNDARMCWKFEF